MNTKKQSDAIILRRKQELADAGFTQAEGSSDYVKDTTTVSTQQVEFCSHKEWQDLTTEDDGGTEEDAQGEGEGNGTATASDRELTNEELEAAAGNETIVANARKIIAVADSKAKQKNKTAPVVTKDDDELTAAMHLRNVKKYGKDFVTAKRGTNQMYFTRAAWNSMGKNKQGWVEQTKEMPEAKKATEAKAK